MTLLVCIAGLALLFAGSYPRGVYDFVLGMNHWGTSERRHAFAIT